MFEKIKYYLIVGFLAIITFLLFKNFTAIQDLTQKNIVEEIKQKDNSEQQNSSQIDVEKQESRTNNSNFDSQNSQNQSNEIDKLTAEDVVVEYLKQNGNLPEYYITKGEAKSQGWIASQGNLCEVLPNRAIGGDNFSNREGNLPKENGRKYFEADLNYNCGRRGKDRVVFSSDGLIFVTHNHYESFDQK